MSNINSQHLNQIRVVAATRYDGETRDEWHTCLSVRVRFGSVNRQCVDGGYQCRTLVQQGLRRLQTY